MFTSISTEMWSKPFNKGIIDVEGHAAKHYICIKSSCNEADRNKAENDESWIQLAKNCSSGNPGEHPCKSLAQIRTLIRGQIAGMRHAANEKCD